MQTLFSSFEDLILHLSSKCKVCCCLKECHIVSGSITVFFVHNKEGNQKLLIKWLLLFFCEQTIVMGLDNILHSPRTTVQLLVILSQEICINIVNNISVDILIIET